jgi:hypothetical protein
MTFCFFRFIQHVMHVSAFDDDPGVFREAKEVFCELGQGLFPSSVLGQNEGSVSQERVRFNDFGIAGGEGDSFIDKSLACQFKRACICT